MCGAAILISVNKGLVVMAPRGRRENVIQSFHDNLGRWGTKATQKLVNDRLWGLKVHSDAACNVDTCDACQHMQGLPLYKTSFCIPQSSLFEVFSIGFASQYPQSKDSIRFFLNLC